MKFLFFLLVGMGAISGWSADGNIDLNDKLAWAENAGWINARPFHGGVQVHNTFLSGYCWGENIGWIKVGSEMGGPYANTGIDDWGINRDGNVLSGFAWSENIGWINFSPSQSQVTLDPLTGVFDGFAWSENVGWIHLNSQIQNPAYQVKAVFSTAEISGDTELCKGGCADILVSLTGFGPWTLEWSDGFIQANITEPVITRTVTPETSTLYSVVHVEDPYSTGRFTGDAKVEVHPFAISTNPVTSIPQGWDPEVLEVSETCGLNSTIIQWRVISGPDAGYEFDPDENPIVLEDPLPIPLETTDYLVTVTDGSTCATLEKTVRVLVAVDSFYFDVIPDQCNNLNDLWALCPEWLEIYPSFNDPDGDGRFSVLDYLYINLTDSLNCQEIAGKR